MRVKVGRPVGPHFLRIAVDIGQHRQDRGRVVPLLTTSGIGHHDELPEGERSGIDADDARELVHELINAFAHSSGLIDSSIVSARSSSLVRT